MLIVQVACTIFQYSPRHHQSTPGVLFLVLMVLAAIMCTVVLLPTSISPLQHYKNHLCDLYLDEPNTQHTILSKDDLFIEPVLERLETFSAPVSDLTVRGDLDSATHRKMQTNLSQLFNTPVGHGHRIFIRGHPGSGKTTLLKQLSKLWAKAVQDNQNSMNNLSGCVVMLLVCLRDLWTYDNPRNISVQDLFTSIGSTPYLMNNDPSKLLVPENRLCILLDGLDEYSPGHTERSNYIHQIISSKKLKKATVFVTSHPEAISTMPRSYNIYARIEIMGFDWNRVKKFVAKYYASDSRSVADKNTKKMLDYLREKKVVRFMCYVPLYLHMLIFINEIDDTVPLPVTPTEIFIGFVVQTLKEELKSIDENLLFDDRCLAISIQYNHLSRCSSDLANRFAAICELAYNGIYNVINSDSPLVSERPSVITYFSQNSVPDILRSHSLGLLFSHQVVKPLAAVERVYTFQHLALQEFLAAYHLSKLALNHQIDLIKHPFFPGNVSTFFCGLHKFAVQNESMLFTVIEHLLNNIYVSSLPLAAQCVFESQHPGAAKELLHFSNGSIDLTCIHPGSIVLSNPPMTKANLVPFDESFFQVALEYIFTQAHAFIYRLKLVELCNCLNIKWHEVIGIASSLSSLSVISMDFCSKDTMHIYLDTFSVALDKASNLKHIEVINWPYKFREGVLEQIRTHSSKLELSKLEYVCDYKDVLPIKYLIDMLLDIVCIEKLHVKNFSLHCATLNILELKPYFVYPFLNISKNHCINRIFHFFQHLDVEPFYRTHRHCESRTINLQEKFVDFTACGNRYLDAIEWVIDVDIVTL